MINRWTDLARSGRKPVSRALECWRGRLLSKVPAQHRRSEKEWSTTVVSVRGATGRPRRPWEEGPTRPILRGPCDWLCGCHGKPSPATQKRRLGQRWEAASSGTTIVFRLTQAGKTGTMRFAALLLGRRRKVACPLCDSKARQCKGYRPLYLESFSAPASSSSLSLALCWAAAVAKG